MSVGFIARAGEAQRLAWIAGSEHRIVLDAATTEGRLTVIRSTMQRGTASPVHVHDAEDETVMVLEGSGIVWVGDRKSEIGAGDTAFLPRGVPHTYLFTSDTVELLTICNPSGMEEFFRAAGWDLSEPPPPGWEVDLGELASAGERAGQRVLGPPLAAEDLMPEAYRTR